MSFYLESSIWPNVISQWIQQKNSECVSNFVQISDKARKRPWQWIDKHLGKKAWAIHRYLIGNGTEKGKLSVPLTSKGLFTKNLSWQVRQSIPHTTVIFMAMCENLWRLCPGLRWQNTWLLHHDNTPYDTNFLIRDFFLTRNSTIVIPPPTTLPT
jgi:hypothetical protein